MLTPEKALTADRRRRRAREDQDMRLAKEEQSHLRGIANGPIFDGRPGDKEGGKGGANGGGRLIGNGQGTGRRGVCWSKRRYSFPGPQGRGTGGTRLFLVAAIF